MTIGVLFTFLKIIREARNKKGVPQATNARKYSIRRVASR